VNDNKSKTKLAIQTILVMFTTYGFERDEQLRVVAEMAGMILAPVDETDIKASVARRKEFRERVEVAILKWGGDSLVA
jgi:hypothetical protein